MAPSSVRRLLKRLGWSVQRFSDEAREREELAIRTWEAKIWSAQQKSSAGQGQIMVFIDESDLRLPAYSPDLKSD